MTLFELLHSKGFKSGNIKQFISNKQIELNGEVVVSNITLDVCDEDIIEVDDFIFYLIMKVDDKALLTNKIRFLGLEWLFENLDELKDYLLLRVTKDLSLVLKKN